MDTPEEIAQAVVEGRPPYHRGYMRDAIAAAIRAAEQRGEQRAYEEAARVAEKLYDNHAWLPVPTSAREIATAILARARGETP